MAAGDYFLLMDELPRGTVTFLATDIQGSTEMWERYPDAMPRPLERPEHLLREAVETRGGRVFKNIGDGLFLAFSACPPAVDAALSAQRSLFGEEWPTPAPVRVRMALHSGHAEERAGDAPPAGEVPARRGAGTSTLRN